MNNKLILKKYIREILINELKFDTDSDADFFSTKKDNFLTKFLKKLKTAIIPKEKQRDRDRDRDSDSDSDSDSPRTSFLDSFSDSFSLPDDAVDSAKKITKKWIEEIEDLEEKSFDDQTINMLYSAAEQTYIKFFKKYKNSKKAVTMTKKTLDAWYLKMKNDS